MNHRDKIIQAIRNQRDRLEELQNARIACVQAENNLAHANQDVGRQIKNVIGLERAVLYDGKIYKLHESGVLEIVDSCLEVLTPTHIG